MKKIITTNNTEEMIEVEGPLQFKLMEAVLKKQMLIFSNYKE